jgi:hypothetical protein
VKILNSKLEDDAAAKEEGQKRRGGWRGMECPCDETVKKKKGYERRAPTAQHQLVIDTSNHNSRKQDKTLSSIFSTPARALAVRR